MKEYAYAKLNLHLDVVKRRDDGFHDIRTVMHTVSLADEVKVIVTDAKETAVSMTVKPSVLPTDDRNLCVIAAKSFLKFTGQTRKVDIHLEKRIPIAGGLAGGSSDAAAVLRALNKLLRKPLGERGLLSLGAEIGSDVPYCILGKTALCEGRGEKMTRIRTAKPYHFVIATAGEYVSTPSAYGELDRIYSDFDGSVPFGECGDAELIQALENGGKLPKIYNIFEDPVLSGCPKSAQIKELMLSLGAEQSAMSGSGPTVFGVFSNETLAEEAAKEIIKHGFDAYAVKST